MDNIEKCIWKTDEFGNPDKNRLKIDSEVSTDDDKEEFLSILKTVKVLVFQKKFQKKQPVSLLRCSFILKEYLIFLDAC